MPNRNQPAIPHSNLPVPNGKPSREMAEIQKKTDQDAMEEAAYAYKQEVASRLVKGIYANAAHNHSDLLDDLQALRDQERGKWAQQQNNAFTEDVAKAHRLNQLDGAERGTFMINDAAERSVKPEPRKPGFLERVFGEEN